MSAESAPRDPRPLEVANVRDLAVGPSGDLAVVGAFGSTLTAGTTVLSGAGDLDGFVMLLSPSGDVRWALDLHGSDGPYYPIDSARAVAVDDEGVVYVAGTFRGTMAVGAEQVVSRGWDDVYLLALGSDGVPRWLRRLGGAQFDEPTALAVAGDHVALTGGFQEVADLGVERLVSAGGSDGFVAVLDRDGELRWWRRFGAWDGDRAYAVAIDRAGDTYVSVGFARSVDVGAGPIDGFGTVVARYDSGGALRWNRVFRAAGIGDVALAPGALIAVGAGGARTTSSDWAIDERRLDDGLLLALDPADGHTLCEAAVGGAGDDGLASVAVGSAYAIAGGSQEEPVLADDERWRRSSETVASLVRWSFGASRSPPP